MLIWNIEEMTGYKPKTTFWNDFNIAEQYGVDGIKDTYKRAFNNWKTDYIYLTELVMVLNHKMWQWVDKNNEWSRLYQELWEEADEWACCNLQGKELQYFYDTTG